MKVKPKYLTYEALPCAGCKKSLMAAYGMYMDPGPRMPGLPGSLMDYYGGYPESDLPASRVQGPAPVGSIDTNRIKLPQLPGISPRDMRPQKQGKKGPNYGNAALLAMTAFDALLPNPVSRQQVVQPQMGYNPNPYGTGSQALKQGGLIPMANYGYVMGEDENNTPSAKDGHWIQKAVNPAHKGYCTPMTKSTCTPRRKALARTFKKMARNRKKEDGGHINDAMSMITADMDMGGFIQPGFDKYKKGGIIPDNMSVFNPHEYANGGTERGGSDTTDLLEQWMAWRTGTYEQGGTARGGSDTTDLLEQWIPWMTGDYENGGSARGGSDTVDLLEQWIPWRTGDYASGGIMPGMHKMPDGSWMPNHMMQMAQGGELSSAKAKEMLKDGTAHGKKLTAKQKRYFGMVAAGKAAFGTEIGYTGPETGDPKPKPKSTVPNPGSIPVGAEMNWTNRRLRTGQIEKDALSADRMAEIINLGYDPFTGKGRAVLDEIRRNTGDDQFATDFGVRVKSLQGDPTFMKLTPEERLNRFYQTGATGTTGLDDFLRRTKSFGGSPAAYMQGNPSLRMAQGGVLYDDGGAIDTMWGGNAQLESYNPYDGGTVEFNGDSHAQGGIGMQYNGNPVEVEGGEYASRDGDGNLTIYGNMFIPGTKTKFKKAASAIADREKRYDFLKTKGSDLVNNSNPASKFEQLKFNAGKVMMQGGEMGQKDLASKKEKLASLQRAMLGMAEQHGLDPQAMSQGKMKKAKGGASIPFYQDGGDANDPTRADRNNNPGNIKYGDFAKKYGAKKDKDGFAIFPDKEKGLEAMKSLLKSKSYNNLSVKDAIYKWTDKHPYRYDVAGLENTKVSDLSNEQFEAVIGAMRQGEGTRYGVRPSTPQRTPTPTPQVPVPSTFTPYTIPDMDITPEAPRVKPVNPVPPYDQLEVPERRPIRSNVEPLHMNQVLPELYGIATNKVEPVPTQRYEPQLYTPYQVSFQDRLNQNQAAFNAQMRAVGPSNPSAIGTLAAQKYQADQAVLGDEFRTNQSISNDITNKNIAIVNDANLKNLGLADTQMTRQSQARSNTRAFNQMILNSLSSKYAQNELENKRLAAYENLYDYRFVPQNDGGLSATYFGPNAMFNYNGRSATGQKAPDVRTISRYDASGNLRGYNEYDESELKTMQRILDIEDKKTKEALMPQLRPLK